LLTKRPLEAGLGDATIDRHPGLATVVSVSIQRLEATNPLAVQVLKILGLLAPEPVPVMPERPDTEAGSAAFGVRFGDVGATARSGPDHFWIGAEGRAVAADASLDPTAPYRRSVKRRAGNA
jgi:hypothetical protein